MKKILYLIVVASIAAMSCDKFDDDIPNSSADMFIARVEGADTKTVIEGMKSYWNGTEVIKVLDGNKSKKYSATLTERSSTATFTAQDATTLTGDDYIAVYPGDILGDVTWNGNVASNVQKFWLGCDQTAVSSTYDITSHIAVSHVNAGENLLDFRNVNALVKVQIPYTGITEVCFYGNSGENISGNFDVSYNDGNPIISTPTGTNRELHTHVKITAKANQTLSGTYYLSILPTTFKNGFTVEYVMNGIKYIKRNNGEYTVHRNQIIDLPSVEYTAFSPQSGQVYLIPNDDWKSNAARFAAYFYDTAGYEKWVNMTRVPNTYIYECKVPTDKDYLGVIFCRMNPSSTSNGWTQDTQLWNKSGDQLLCIGNQFEITGWDTGTWKGDPIYSDYLFLKPNTNWVSGNARFAAYFFGNGDVWVNMKDVNLDGFYEVRKPTSKKYPSVIFCRMNPTGTNGWTQDTQKWNQTSDLTIPTTSNLYTIKEGTWDKGGGSWTKMTF